MRNSQILLSVALLATCLLSSAANPFPCDPEKAARYTAFKISEPLTIDGKLDEEAWLKHEKSPRFVDIISGEPVALDTRAAVLWDDDYLYVGFWVEEPRLYGTLKNENDPVWQENDIEVFIAGADAYYEFELSPLNTRYQVMFLWEDNYDKNNFSQEPTLARDHPDMRDWNGVNFTTHPRGPRLGAWGYRMPGLLTGVTYKGTMNNNDDVDEGWYAEIAFPWKSMELLAKGDGRSLPPVTNDVWRMDFSRFNIWRADEKDTGGWFWTPHGEWDSHIPECFAYIEFKNVLREDIDL